MFDAVLFDFDGTLVDLRANDVAAVTALLEAVGLEADAEQFVLRSITHLEQAFDAGEWVDDIHAYRLRHALADHGVGWREEYRTVFLDAFVSAVPAHPGAAQALEWLGERTRVGLVTNSIEAQVQRARIRASGLAEHFDLIVVAGEFGSFKPEARIFTVAAERLGAAPARSLFVGDSELHDISGARAVGMATVRRVEQPCVTEADATYAHFADLPGIVSDLWRTRREGSGAFCWPTSNDRAHRTA